MRLNRCTALRITCRYGRAASSGSVVGNDPVNLVDPSGKFGAFGAAVGGALEVYEQAESGELQSAWSTGADRLSGGDVVGALQAVAGSSAKIAISAGAGALTGGLAGNGAKLAWRVAAAAVSGATGNAAGQAGKNIVDGKPTLSGTGRSAAAGAVGGAVGSKIGQVVSSRITIQAAGRINPKDFPNEKAWQRYLAREAGERAGRAADAAVSTSAAAADTVSCGVNGKPCQ